MTPELDAVLRIARHCWHGEGSAHWVKTPKGPVCVKRPLLRAELERHVSGGDPVGLAPIVPGTSTTRIAVLDFDSHKGETPWDRMVLIARGVATELAGHGLRPIPFRSSGRHGIHLYMLWEQDQDAYSVRQLLIDALGRCKLKNGTKGVAEGQVEIFPKQDSVAEDGFGSMFILPFAKESELIDIETGVGVHPDNLPGVWPLSDPVPYVERPVQEYEAPTDGGHAPHLDRLRRALEKIGNADLDYDAWRDYIFAIHDADPGDAGLELAKWFSAKSSKHDPEFLESRVWPYIKDNREGARITAERIFVDAEAKGWNANVLDELRDEDAAPAPASAGQDVPVPRPEVRFPARSLAEHVRAVGTLKWHIEGVLPQLDLVTILGASGAGKSFVALDMAVSIAIGLEWGARRVRQGRVAYLAAEGAAGMGMRLRAYQAARGVDLEACPIDMYPYKANLYDQGQAKELHESMRARAESLGQRYSLIIVDTLAAASAGMNENSAEDVGKLLNTCRIIAEKHKATVLLVHHLGKDETKGARGSSALKGAADAEIEVRRADHLRQIEVKKMKDGAEGIVIGFTLNVIDLGEDEEGTKLSSCVVQLAEVHADAMPRVKPPGHAMKRMVWDAVQGLSEFEGYTSYDAVRESVRMLLPPDRANFQRDFDKAFDGLRMEGRIVASDRMSKIRWIR